jgi:hypothetical protein
VSVRRLARAAAVALALLFSVRPASADPPTPSDVEQGRLHFNRGVQYYRSSDFRSALVEFREAYRIAPSFKILYDLAQTNVELQDYASAVKAYRAYLAQGGASVAADRRAEVEGKLATLEPRVGQVDLSVNVPGATVVFEGERRIELGTAPFDGPVFVNPGAWKAVATKDGYLPASADLAVAGGEHKQVSLDLVPRSPGAPPEPAHPDATPAHPSRLGAPVWIGIAVTGALAVGAGVTGALALGAKSDYDAKQGTLGVSHADLQSASQRTQTLALVTDILGGAAIVSAGVTAYLFFTRGAPPAKKGTVGWRLLWTGAGVGAAASF